jgi:hypothetical protein
VKSNHNRLFWWQRWDPEGDPAREPSLKTIPEKKTNTPLQETKTWGPKEDLVCRGRGTSRVSFHAFLQERRRETALEGALRPRDLGHQTKAGTAAGDESSASDGHLGGLRGTRPNAQQLAH